MRIQSAGRLGNILHIWAHAINLNSSSGNTSVVIFADKYHTKINEDLLETFEFLSGHGVSFEVNNLLGFALKIVDKLDTIAPVLAKVIRRIFRIETEGMDVLSDKAWIQRGFFQDESLSPHTLERVNDVLWLVLRKKILNIQLRERMPFLAEAYQAVHIRRTDYFATEFGVIKPNSQMTNVREDLKIVVCTDSSKEDLVGIIDINSCEIITQQESSAWETLAILASAKHLVIANSSLSFWAGFLASKNGGFVCVPKIWNKTRRGINKFPFNPQVEYHPNFE